MWWHVVHRFVQRAVALGRPHATYRIVEDLAMLAQQQFDKVNFVSKRISNGSLAMA